MPDDDFELDTNPPPIAATTEPPEVDNDVLEEVQLDFNKGTLNTVSDPISQSQEATRARIAWVFTQVFLVLILFALILPISVSILAPNVVPNPIESTKEFVTLIASVLAGPFGFIVGFYFKEQGI